eukprot:scaffold3346_cov313-Pinguiococcus_pyrenoidosus.AAC.3
MVSIGFVSLPRPLRKRMCRRHCVRYRGGFSHAWLAFGHNSSSVLSPIESPSVAVAVVPFLNCSPRARHARSAPRSLALSPSATTAKATRRVEASEALHVHSHRRLPGKAPFEHVALEPLVHRGDHVGAREEHRVRGARRAVHSGHGAQGGRRRSHPHQRGQSTSAAAETAHLHPPSRGAGVRTFPPGPARRGEHVPRGCHRAGQRVRGAPARRLHRRILRLARKHVCQAAGFLFLLPVRGLRWVGKQNRPKEKLMRRTWRACRLRTSSCAAMAWPAIP